MKRKLLALLLASAMIGGTFAFAGCDTVSSDGGSNSAGGNQNGQDEADKSDDTTDSVVETETGGLEYTFLAKSNSRFRRSDFRNL